MVPIGLEGAIGISRRAIDDRQKPKKAPVLPISCELGSVVFVGAGGCLDSDTSPLNHVERPVVPRRTPYTNCHVCGYRKSYSCTTPAMGQPCYKLSG